MRAASTPATEPREVGARAPRRIPDRRAGTRTARPRDAGPPGTTRRTIAG